MACYNYFLLYWIFTCLYLISEIESYTPDGRFAHSSALAGSKLYFFGGKLPNQKLGKFGDDVFYLDLSQPFNMANPPWNDLTPIAKMPFRSGWGTASFSNISDEPTIYLFNGITLGKGNQEYITVPEIYSFNLNSSTWNTPTAVKGNPPNRRRNIQSVIDNTGKMYIFGGFSNPSVLSVTTYFNEMVIFNTAELSWSISNSPIAGRISYSATLLPNGIIAYIGGSDSISVIDISKIDLYDTNSLTWSNKIAKQIDPIDNRDSHSAVLTPNGMIIIYGGKSSAGTQVIPDLAVLNTETFEWTVPKFSSDVGTIPSLSAHSANLVGDYMIVAFGNNTQQNNYSFNKSSKIYMLDVRSYTWVYTFGEPSTSIPTDPSLKSSSKPLTTTGIIIVSVCSAAGVAIIIIGFFGYRYYKSQKKIIRVGGSA